MKVIGVNFVWNTPCMWLYRRHSMRVRASRDHATHTCCSWKTSWRTRWTTTPVPRTRFLLVHYAWLCLEQTDYHSVTSYMEYSLPDNELLFVNSLKSGVDKFWSMHAWLCTVYDYLEPIHLLPEVKQENHAIAKMTARCAQYVSALKIIGLFSVSAKSADGCARISTLQSYRIRWGGEIIFEVFHPCDHGT